MIEGGGKHIKCRPEFESRVLCEVEEKKSCLARIKEKSLNIVYQHVCNVSLMIMHILCHYVNRKHNAVAIMFPKKHIDSGKKKYSYKYIS